MGKSLEEEIMGKSLEDKKKELMNDPEFVKAYEGCRKEFEKEKQRIESQLK